MMLSRMPRDDLIIFMLKLPIHVYAAMLDVAAAAADIDYYRLRAADTPCHAAFDACADAMMLLLPMLMPLRLRC